MPGPSSKKQSQRTKGNVKPSSSSQAAQLLSQSGAAPTGFIGFGTLTGTPGYVPVSQSLDDVDSSLDADFRMVLRKLTKRDSTTKLKALQEIATLCNEKDIEVVKAVLPFWPRIYNKIAMDIDHRVREATQQSMNTLVLRVRKNLAPYLKSLMGSWLLSQCDTYPTVASAAQQAFQTAFPPAKQVDALVFCKQEVTENLIDNLLKQTSLTLSDPKTTEPEDMESKYNRVMTSSLLALRKLITTLPDGELLPLSSQFDGLLKDSKLWKHGKSTIKSVRAAVFSFLAGFCQTYPQLAMEHSKKVSPFILHSVDESDPLICPCVWEAVLSLVNYVKDCWQHISVDKAFWPKLRSLLENGCHGNAAIIAGDLLPFLSKVPADIRGEDNRFYEEFFIHMKLSFSKEQVKASHIEQAALTKACIECAYFVLRQLDGAQSGAKCAHIILIDQVLPVVQVSLLERKSTLNKSQLYSQLGGMLSSLEATGTDITVELVKTFWDDLGDSIEERIISPFEDLKDRKEFIHRVISFVKSLVVPETSLKSKKEAKVSFSADRNTEDKIVTIPSDRAELSALAKHFVQKLTLKSFEVCHKTWTPEVLHLFVALIELEPSEDTISKIIKYCHGDVESSQSHSHYFVFEVCLPWLHQSQAEGQEFADPSQLLSVICTFIPLLDKDSVLSLLEKLCETITQWTSFHFLLEKVISLQLDVDGTREWLHSDALGNKLMTIATEVCKESMDETNFDRKEVQYGWDTLTLVLSKGYEIVKQEFIEKMLERIHQSLVDIGQSSEVNKVNLAIRFVSKAVQSFFLSSKDCAMLPAAQELLLSLFKVSTDPSYDISDNSMHLAEEAWTSGIGRIVKQTGGFLQKDTLLYKTAEVIQSRILRVETLQKFEALVLVVQKVLSVLRDNVPSEEGENAVVKCYTQQLHLKEEQTVAKKVLDYILVKENISLIDVPVQKVHSSHSLVQVLFTSLFNVRLLTIKSSTDTDQQPNEVDLQQREIILNILYGVVVVQLWMEMDRSVSKFADISKASESLQTGITDILQCMPQTEKNQLLQYALQRSEDKGNLWVLALQKLLSIFSAQSEFTLELSPLLDRCADLTECNVQMLQVCLDVMEEASCTTLSEIMVARLISCPPDTVLQVEGGLGALAVLNTALRRSQQQCVTDLCQATLSQIEEWKDQIDEFMLCESNLKDASYQMVLFNIEIVKFLQFCVQAIPTKFSEKDWDFVLCSMVSLTQSIEESYGVLQTNMAVQSFTNSVCRLLATVAHCIQIKLSQEPSAFPANLQTEWNEFFSDGAYSILIPIFNNVINDLKGQNITGTSHILLQSIGLALSYCPKQQVLDHKLPAYLIADQLSVLPDHLQTLMNRLCPLLSHSDHSVQISVFKMLRSVITDLAQYDKEVKDNAQAKVKDDPDDKAEEQTSRSPPPSLMNIVENSSVAMEIVLSDLTVEECQCVKPNTEEFQFTMAYLLAWKLLLEFFRSAPAELRQEYATFFRDSASVSHLMSNVFRLMSDNPSSVDKVSSSSTTLFECPWQPSVDDEPSSLEIQHLACQVYTDALRTMPAMVRQWWKDQDRKTSNYIDKYTSKFVSQMLCTEELKSVSKTDVNLEYITIRARPTTKEVIATYALEEVSIEIVISLSQNYPLGNINVTSEKKVGVTAGVWDRWLLQLNIFLQYQNGNIVDGLRIWKKNIDKRFEGVDDCMICYSVLHGTNFQLPRLQCKTCKKKFHSACLYKWFQTSHNATCPLCRNLF